MITAEAARDIAGSRVASAKDSPLFKYAIEQVDRYVKEAASCGKRCFSYNIDALAPGSARPDLHMRKALAEELKKNGFSYRETWMRSIGCIWFEVSW